uniref:Uncharacterized protein n=1 Tax=Avena sativa TaxID=4498 RepID=A0ACD5ULN3_AVESA
MTRTAPLISQSQMLHYKDSVASISLFHGDTMLFACSGTALPQGRESLNVARFVTSARLTTEFNNKRSKDDILSIRVRLPDNTITNGFLGLYDDSIAIVYALLSYVHPVDLYLSKEERKCEPTNLIIAGLAADPLTSLMVEGVNTLSSGQKRPRHPRAPSLLSVSCDITEAGLGGPVIAFCHGTELEFLAGVIVSYDCKSKVAVYVQTDALCQRLKHFQIPTNKAINFRGYSLPSGVRCAIPSGFWVSVQRFISLGYPPRPPLVCEFNGTLLNMFEEDFGRLLAWEGYPFCVSQRGYGEDVWEELPKHVVTKVELSVVSLASFNGDVRFFACTGVLINWPGRRGDAVKEVILTSASLVRTEGGKIDENLHIKVFVPPHLVAEGKIELYHQNYNIAILGVTSTLGVDDDISRWDISLKPLISSEVVVAIGRNPSKGLLMASKGKVAPPYKHCELKCKALKLSTCQIKKARIGGPLIDVNGNFVGMNFYDGNTTTPFLPRSTILKALKTASDLQSNRGWTGATGVMNNVGNKNWWPVPEAYWYHSELDLDKSVLPRHVGKVRH